MRRDVTLRGTLHWLTNDPLGFAGWADHLFSALGDTSVAAANFDDDLGEVAELIRLDAVLLRQAGDENPLPVAESRQAVDAFPHERAPPGRRPSERFLWSDCVHGRRPPGSTSAGRDVAEVTTTSGGTGKFMQLRHSASGSASSCRPSAPPLRLPGFLACRRRASEHLA
jgi:hypothetical protein